MKILSWVHRKLRQNSIEPFKEFTNGNSCAHFSAQSSAYEQQYYPKPTFSHANSRQVQGGCQKISSEELNNKKVEEVHEEEKYFMINTPFDGFLTIGTLGSEQIGTEPSTPTFPMPFEKTTKEETDVTENDLKLISDELEKFLQAEAKEVGDESPERSSHVSIITLCEKQNEGMDTKECGDSAVCPLQGYLFNSAIELPETCTQVKKERTSLEQLFNRNNIAPENFKSKCEKVENHTKGIYAKRLVRKMLKTLHCSSKSCAPPAADPVPPKRKLPKVLRMFHKKVHPERSTAEEFTKSHDCEIEKCSINGGCNKGNLTLQGQHNRALFNKEITNINPTNKRLNSSGLTQKREHWIKTDADYLVLELKSSRS